MEQFVSALGAAGGASSAPSLEEICLVGNPLRNRGVPLCRTLEVGYEDVKACGEKGALALSLALMQGGQHVRRLEKLSIASPFMTSGGAFALLHAALAQCPLLTTVELQMMGGTKKDVERLEGIVRALRGETRILKFVGWSSDGESDQESDEGDEEESDAEDKTLVRCVHVK